MIDPSLQSNLEPAARAFQRRQLLRRLALCWAAAAAAGLLCFIAGRLTGWASPYTLPVLLTAALAVAGELFFRSQNKTSDYFALARTIESEHPELRAVLLTAVEQQPQSPSGNLNYLQQRVIASALDHHHRHPWDTGLAQRLSTARLLNWTALVCFLVVLAGLRGSVPRKGAGTNPIVNGVAVTPGDIALERGSGLVVLARFEGKLPADATLVVKPANENQRRIPLTKNLDDPVFGGSIPEVKGDLKYYVQYGAEKTPEYKVTVFEYPRLEHADARITYPAYTGIAEKTIVDTRRVSAVEGSALDYSFFLNKPVVTAQLVAKDQPVVTLTRDTNSPGVYHTHFTLDQRKRFELVLVDDAGRTNKLPPEFVLEALKNRAPELKLALPRGDQRVSPLEEVSFRGEASDDFGLRAYGLAVTMAGQETKLIQLGTNSKPNEKRPMKYLLPMESLNAQPGELLSYYLWADDFGPDGKLRRTSSDMYFAEVRPFDEIFREQQGGQAQGAGAMGGQQQSAHEKLLQLQKDTISATWNLQRRETGAKPSPEFNKDAVVVRDAQNDAIEQVKADSELVKNPESKILVRQAQKSMEKAATKLSDAVTKNSAAPLSLAISDEQSALQAVIKLQAHEFQVSKGQRGGRGGGGGGQRQQQVDQLDLQQTENRYETQREASPAQNQQQREQLQVANRLKELAQRQRDLNEKVKELQTSLQEAKTEQQKQEIRDRLKRLQEEEKDMLADVDELRQRMDRPENQSRMAESRQQLDQTRSEVQKTEEALKQESAAKALAAGTRAERELQQLQDDFRKKNSSQFAEEMRQMRQEARKLAQDQDEIAKKLNDLADAKQKTLNDSDERRAVASQMTQQKSILTNLFNEMRQVSEQSETAEPLLSKQLYDTIRQSAQDDIEKPLDMSSELVQRGFLPQAGPYEQRARQNIDQLKTSVERAAQSVLGDDTEALKLAQRELDELSRELDGALAQAGGTNNSGTNAALAASQSEQGPRSPSGPQSPQSRQPGQGQPGQGQPGQRDQPGQGQASSDQETAAAGRSGQDGRGASGQGAQGQRGQGGQRGQAGRGQSGQRGQGAGQSGNGQQETASAESGQPGGAGQPSDGAANGGNRRRGGRNGGGGGRLASGSDDLGGVNYGGGGDWRNNPLTGDNFVDWSDRLRNVEEMVDLPDLRTDVARIRDRARAIRIEYKRLGKKPDWAVVRTQISTPLAEVRNRVGEELARRESKEALVPIDRDPVPPKFAERVKKYYEQLGKSD